jgi:peptidoglycan/xylan/chitin deacetylase (PgdA/CDA1 family)
MKTLHFLYHELRRDDSRYAYVTAADAFEAQVAFFAKNLATLQPALLLPAVTFDDGYRSDCEIALPILQKHGMTARFFITAGWTGERAAYMDWSQLRTLAAAGMSVGAHGWSHTLLTHCTDAELDRELRGARETLENGLGQPVTTMSLPGGRADARVLRACRAAGYEQIFTSVPRAEEMAAAPVHVGRLNVRGGADLAWFERVLAANERALHKLERTEKIKAIARQALGDRLYAKLWALLNRQEEPDGAGALAS